MPRYTSKEWYTAEKMARTGKGEAGVTAGTKQLYRYMIGTEPIETSGLSPTEQRALQQVRTEVQAGYYRQQAGVTPTKAETLQTLYGAQEGYIEIPEREKETIVPVEEKKEVPAFLKTQTEREMLEEAGITLKKDVVLPSERRREGFSSIPEPFVGMPITEREMLESAGITLKPDVTLPSERFVSEGSLMEQPVVSPYEGEPMKIGEEVKEYRREARVEEAFEKVDFQPFYTASEFIVSLGGALEYKPSRVPAHGLISEPSVTGITGTMIYRRPTLEEMTPEQRLQTQVTQQQVVTYLEAEKIAKEAKTQKEFEESFAPVKERFGAKVTGYEKAYQKEIMAKTVGLTFAKGLVVGAITVVAPPIGYGLMGVSAVRTVREWESVRQAWGVSPKLTLAHVGAGFTGAVIGGVGVSMVAPKVAGFVRTVRLKRIAPEKVIEPAILRGEKTFPTAPQKLHYELFTKSPYKLPKEPRVGVWHAAPARFAKQFKVEVGKVRTGEPVGLYTAPSISAYFLRTGGGYKLFGVQTKTILKTPTVLRITPRGIVRGVRGRMGYAEIVGKKMEVEAVLPPTTPLKRIGVQYYTEWRGTRIPIFQYEVAKGVGRARVGEISTFQQISRAYSYPYGKPTPIITPSRVISSLIYKPTGYVPYGEYVPTKRIVPYLKPSKVTIDKGYTPFELPKRFRISREFKLPKYGVSDVSYPPSAYKYASTRGYEVLPPEVRERRITQYKPLKIETEWAKTIPRRRYHYYPSLAALGLKGTEYEKYFKAEKIPALVGTGIVTRPLTPMDIKWGETVEIARAPIFKSSRKKQKGGKR